MTYSLPRVVSCRTQSASSRCDHCSSYDYCTVVKTCETNGVTASCLTQWVLFFWHGIHNSSDIYFLAGVVCRARDEKGGKNVASWNIKKQCRSTSLILFVMTYILSHIMSALFLPRESRWNFSPGRDRVRNPRRRRRVRGDLHDKGGMKQHGIFALLAIFGNLVRLQFGAWAISLHWDKKWERARDTKKCVVEGISYWCNWCKWSMVTVTLVWTMQLRFSASIPWLLD